MDNPLIPSKSPLENLSIGRFGGHTYAEENTKIVMNAVGVVIINNPNRVFWILINNGGNDVRLSFSAGLGVYTSFILPANGGVMSMSWEEDGESVGYAVYGYATADNTQCFLREVIRQ